MKHRWWLAWLVIVAVLVGIYWRVFAYDWGHPFYFHPDERNIASAVNKLDWPDQLDPHFYAYGSLPLYVIYFTRLALQQFDYAWPRDVFIFHVWISRFWSVIWSTGLIGLFYLTAVRLVSHTRALVGSLALAVMAGMIQFAHFGTFEMWLSFWRLLFLYGIIAWQQARQKRYLLIASLALGVSTAVKVSSLILLPVLFLVWLTGLWSDLRDNAQADSPATAQQQIFSWLAWGVVILLLPLSIWLVSNPTAWQIARHNFWNWRSWFNPEFVHSINVESGIARGEIKVFYTRQFINSHWWFYLVRVWPWIMGPSLFLGLWLAGVGRALQWLRDASSRQINKLWFWPMAWLLVHLAFLFSIYVKWTRYFVPLLPVWLLLLLGLWPESKKRAWQILAWLGLGVHLVWGVMWFNIYRQPDPRIAAANWAKQRFDRQTKVLSEVYDLGIVPWNPHFDQIKLFNFYQLDSDPASQAELTQELEQQLAEADVFVVLSRRVWYNSLQQPDQFPLAAAFYQRLFDGETEFRLLREFTRYPRLGPLTLPDETITEETMTVFDHPRVQVWVKLNSEDVF